MHMSYIRIKCKMYRLSVHRNLSFIDWRAGYHLWLCYVIFYYQFKFFSFFLIRSMRYIPPVDLPLIFSLEFSSHWQVLWLLFSHDKSKTFLLSFFLIVLTSFNFFLHFLMTFKNLFFRKTQNKISKIHFIIRLLKRIISTWYDENLNCCKGKKKTMENKTWKNMSHLRTSLLSY